MYNRQAKSVDQGTWRDLMSPATWKEVKEVIDSNGTNKSAGWDGVTSDLVKPHTEDSSDSPTPLLELLSGLASG